MDWITNIIVAVFTTLFNLIIETIQSSFKVLWGIITKMFTTEFLIILIIAIIITLLIIYLPRKKGGKS